MQLKRRDLNGLLLLDKPLEHTSNDALQRVKGLFNAKKAGHSGSLDPLATGMLPICFGEGTKFLQYLLDADKTYLVTAKLGITTATGDAEGEIINRQTPRKFSEKEILAALHKFSGQIEQIPSMYSAIKHQGQPLYKLARQGITVDRKPRTITIHKIELLSYEDDSLVLKISCSKGTYIRTLVEDVGNILGCGAHISQLRRMSVAHFSARRMVTISEIEDLYAHSELPGVDSLLLPIAVIVENWCHLQVSEAAIYYLLRGQSVIIPYAPTSGMVSLENKAGEFFGIGEILADGKVAPRRLLKT